MILKNFILFLLVMTSTALYAYTWQQKASFGGTGRHRATGISIANKGYMGLGQVNGTGIHTYYNDWWEYDPASNSWAQKANFPANNRGAVAFSTDTKGYVGGGYAFNGEFFEYDPQLNTWTPIANCPFSPDDVQVFSVQNKGYVVFGNQLAEYNPTSNSWTIKANPPIYINYLCSSFSTESSGFVKSGFSLYEYKPVSNEWLQRDSFPGQMIDGTAAFSINQKGYFTSGFLDWSAQSNLTDEVWEYDPANDLWTLINQFPGTKRRYCVAFSINDKGYFGGGTNGTNLNDFWQLDSTTLTTLNTDMIISEDYDLDVYPNPAKEDVNFKFSKLTNSYLNDFDFILYTFDGRKIRDFKITSTEFNVNRNDLPNGVYYYSIYKEGAIKLSGKLIYN